ncbi:MAG: hypothetical protein Q9173_000804 [Seirophora scorigena]
MSEPSDHTASDSVSPPIRGRQRSGGNDSLWKRAKKTLGTDSLTFLQSQGKPATDPDDPTGRSSSKTTPGKRREQVRNAQRTHRQRTQNYIKTLESEVLRLRGSEGDLTQANKKLQNQVDLLRTTLLSANVQLPAGFEGSPQSAQPSFPSFDMPATIAYRADNANHERLHVTWPEPPPPPPARKPLPQSPQCSQQPPDLSFEVNFDSAADHSNQDWYGTSSKPLPHLPRGTLPLSALTSPTDANAFQDTSVTPLDFPNATYENPLSGMASKLDTAEVAIDFVLALEHPCMPHLPHPSDPPSDDPSNHALLLSTPLISRAPKTYNQSETTWTANGSMIEGLLNLSSAINLEGEITPVEAWHRLRQHPGFGRLDRWAVDKIKGDLSLSVRCCG